MLVTQKFNNINDIDLEFIAPLEELLAECTPSFNFIKHHQTSKEKNIYFTYFLFFGDKTNAPIGYAQYEFTEEMQSYNFEGLKKEKLFTRLFGKTENKSYKKINWLIPGSTQEGLVISPQYNLSGRAKTSTLFKDLVDSGELNELTIKVPESLLQIKDDFKVITKQTLKESIPDTLIKNTNTYESFFNEKGEELKLEIKQAWKMVLKDLKYQSKEYHSFKEVFTYKELGAKQYKQLRTDKRFGAYISQENNIYLSLENESEVKLIIIIIKGKLGNLFYDVVSFCEKIPVIISHQLALMTFFDLEDFNKLHYLGEKRTTTMFKKLGFSNRKQFTLKLKP